MEPKFKTAPLFTSQRSHVVVFLILSLLHLSLALFNHARFRTFAFDYGVYNFAFYDFAHFRSNPCPVYLAPYPVSFLQDHFSLTIPLLSPLYWIFTPVTGTYTLLLFQWLCVTAGGWATYRLILMKSESAALSLASMLSYFTLFGLFAALQADCNLATVGGTLLPLLIYFFYSGRYVPLGILFLILSFNREDFPLVLAFLFLFLAISVKEPTKKKTALGLSALSVILFILFFALFIPALEDQDKKFSLFNYSSLGENPAEALQFALLHPLKTIRLLFSNPYAAVEFDWIKSKFYLVYILSGGFLLLLRPLYLLPLVPVLAKKMLNDEPGRWGHESYHGIELVCLMPFLVFSVVSGLRSVKDRTRTGGAVALATCTVTVYCLLNPGYGIGINKYNFLSVSYFQGDVSDIGAMNNALEHIPTDAAVSGSARVLPHLAFRDKIYYFPRVEDADYICLLLRNNSYPLTQPQFEAEISRLQHSGDWSVLASTQDFLLLKRLVKTSIDSIASASQIP